MSVALVEAVASALKRAPASHRLEDFDISAKRSEQARKTSLSVIYRFAEGCWFRAVVPEERVQPKEPPLGKAVLVIECTMSPGELTQTEHRTVRDSDGLVDALRDWLVFLRDYLNAVPVHRELDEQRRLLEQLLAEIGSAPDTYFSREEASQVSDRLSELEGRFRDHLKQASATEAEATDRINKLERDFVELRQQTAYLTKKGWSSSLATRLARWLRDPLNQQLLKSGADIARKLLLPPGPGS